MLILTRKVDETIFIGEDIRIVLVELQDGQARIGISCPDCLTVMRAELGKRTKKMKWPNCSPDEINYVLERYKIAGRLERQDLKSFIQDLQRWALGEYVERYSHWYKEA